MARLRRDVAEDKTLESLDGVAVCAPEIDVKHRKVVGKVQHNPIEESAHLAAVVAVTAVQLQQPIHPVHTIPTVAAIDDCKLKHVNHVQAQRTQVLVNVLRHECAPHVQQVQVAARSDHAGAHAIR
jgi:hypothetical protein